ncbi:hypothetical protein HDV00_002439 [Rhizophlyctis rosea]|nr:hypothetical protein HDV00_002439 [Rhizophlyctis rosea]
MHIRNILISSLIATAAAIDNPVIYWDAQAVATTGGITPAQQSPILGRTYAIFTGAIWGAAYETRANGQGVTAERTAISYAAHDILTGLFPQSSRNLDNALKAYLAEIKKEGGKDGDVAKGKKVGVRIANRLLKKRLDDGYNAYARYNGTWTATGPAPPAGEYIPTPPANAFPPAVPQAGYITPFAIPHSPSHYRIPPPAINSPIYQQYLDEVSKYGARNNSARTTDQTQIAYYWLEPTPSRFHNIATTILKGKPQGKDHHETAKILYLLSLAQADASITTWDVKNHYNTWRPISALRYDGIYLHNKTKVTNPTWTPLLTTPDHQDYVSNHATMGAAGIEVLTQTFGDNTPFTLSYNVTVDAYGPITRTYTSLKKAKIENGDSRLYGGIHFRFANENGYKIGEHVAKDVIKAFEKNALVGLEGVVEAKKGGYKKWKTGTRRA